MSEGDHWTLRREILQTTWLSSARRIWPHQTSQESRGDSAERMNCCINHCEISKFSQKLSTKGLKVGRQDLFQTNVATMAKKQRSKDCQCMGARDGWEDLKGSHQIFSDCQSGIKNGLQPRQSSLILPLRDSCQRPNYNCSISMPWRTRDFQLGNIFIKEAQFIISKKLRWFYIKFDLMLAVYLYSGPLHKNLGLSVTFRSSRWKLIKETRQKSVKDNGLFAAWLN